MPYYNRRDGVARALLWFMVRKMGYEMQMVGSQPPVHFSPGNHSHLSLPPTLSEFDPQFVPVLAAVQNSSSLWWTGTVVHMLTHAIVNPDTLAIRTFYHAAAFDCTGAWLKGRNRAGAVMNGPRPKLLSTARP